MSGIELEIAEIVAVWLAGSAVLAIATGAALRYGVTPVLCAVADLRGRGARELADRDVERVLEEIADRLDRLEAASASASRIDSAA